MKFFLLCYSKLFPANNSLYVLIITFFEATKKRIKEELSLAQTLTAGVLEQAALMKKDKSILVHIRGQDCVAIEARYHRRWTNVVR